MDRKLKIGVLGGGRGVALAEGARANGMEVAAVCDRDELCAKWAAKRLECKSFTDYEQMLDTDIDAVVVANYAVAHVWAVKQALAAGKHVMSECMACNAYNFGHDGMKRDMHWLYSLGINFLVPHAFHYSYNGFRKDDAG